jgi:hypothetical protein
LETLFASAGRKVGVVLSNILTDSLLAAQQVLNFLLNPFPSTLILIGALDVIKTKNRQITLIRRFLLHFDLLSVGMAG